MYSPLLHLHHIYRAANTMLMTLLTVAILAFSASAHSEPASTPDDIYLLDEAEINQRMLNSLWLQQGMEEGADYDENNDALQKLAQAALKKYWALLVKKDSSYARYTPLVNGRFTSASNYNSTDFDIKLSGDSIRFRLDYSF